MKNEKQKYWRCVICKRQYFGWGNNPDPVAKEGKACDECNATKVIPARLKILR